MVLIKNGAIDSRLKKACYNKVASFKRSQCEGCSIIIHLMALYDYYLKYIQGRHIKHTLNLFI